MNNRCGFGDALHFVLVAEGAVYEDGSVRGNGGYVNDPADPGGETKWGISKRAHPSLDIYTLTLSAASEIYQHDYWNNAVPDGCQWPLNLYIFDCAVNLGVRRSAEFLSACENDAEKYLGLRREFYQKIKPELFKRFGKGWLARLDNLKKYGEKMGMA